MLRFLKYLPLLAISTTAWISVSPPPLSANKCARALVCSAAGSSNEQSEGTKPIVPVTISSDEKSSTTDTSNKTDEEQREWGVSYIGGDPCGSKYNTDPFDAQVQ